MKKQIIISVPIIIGTLLLPSLWEGMGMGCGAGAFAQQCPPNMDFETGTFSNWYTESTAPWVYSGWAPDSDMLRFRTISGSGIDSCGGFPMVCPNCGNSVARIGSLPWEPGDGRHSRITYTLLVTSSNANLILNIAMMGEDGFHSISDNPGVRVGVYDSLGNSVGILPMKWVVQPIVFYSSPCYTTVPMYYLPWFSVPVNLSAYIGKTVFISFEVSDCMTGGHDMYAYFDACAGPVVGVNEINEKESITVFPNPTSGEFQIQLASSQKQEASIEIYNVLGEKVYSSIIHHPSSIIHHPSSIIHLNAPSGMYFLHLRSGEGMAVKKIIVNR